MRYPGALSLLRVSIFDIFRSKSVFNFFLYVEPRKQEKGIDDKNVFKRDRLGIIVYIPNSESHVRQFLAFAYASWRHITDKEQNFFPTETTKVNALNNIDILAFCHPQICPHIKKFCTRIVSLKTLLSKQGQTCWAIEQSSETEIPYFFLNSFIMFKRNDITELTKKYKYLLRTDYDVFFSPALWTLKPKRFLFGVGSYSHAFNQRRLKIVAKRLNMVHRGHHDIGSTWLGDSSLFIQITNNTYDVTKHIYLNEFDPTLPGLEEISFKTPDGEWKKWSRGVSSMYGGEIVINHMLPAISDENKGRFDASSCSTESVWKAYHIHCWHNPCHFSKFEFDNFIHNLLHGTKDLSNKLSKELVRNSYEKDTQNMTMQQFSSYIAYNAVGK